MANGRKRARAEVLQPHSEGTKAGSRPATGMEVVYNRYQCSDGLNVKALDEIVSSVVSASGLPTASRRRELERELRGHLEDVTDELRLSGCPDDGIEEVVRARFGDSRAVARSFAEAYKVERILMQATM